MDFPAPTDCHSCGADLPAGARFCGACGAARPEDPLVCPGCGTPAGDRFCTGCGLELLILPELPRKSAWSKDEADACPRCEAAVGDGPWCTNCGLNLARAEDPTEPARIEAEEPPAVVDEAPPAVDEAQPAVDDAPPAFDEAPPVAEAEDPSAPAHEEAAASADEPSEVPPAEPDEPPLDPAELFATDDPDAGEAPPRPTLMERLQPPAVRSHAIGAAVLLLLVVGGFVVGRRGPSVADRSAELAPAMLEARVAYGEELESDEAEPTGARCKQAETIAPSYRCEIDADAHGEVTTLAWTVRVDAAGCWEGDALGSAGHPAKDEHDLGGCL